MANNSDININITANGAQAERAIDRVGNEVNDLGDKAKKAQSGIDGVTKGLLNFVNAAEAARILKDVAIDASEVADKFNLMQAKLKLVTKSEEEFAAAQQAVLDIARESRGELDSTADLYTRVARALKSAGDTSTDVAQVTETVAKAMKISGASTAEYNSVVTQLGQALASGVLRGEEFNSISENGSRVTQLLASNLGVTTGELRKMAQEGKLTTDVVTKAIVEGSAQIDKEFKQIPITIGDSVTLVKNAFAEMVGNFDDATGASTKLAKGIKGIADIIPTIDDYFVAMGEIGAGAFAKMEKAWVDFQGSVFQARALITPDAFGGQVFEDAANRMAMRSAELSQQIEYHQGKAADAFLQAHKELEKSANTAETKATPAFAELNGVVVDLSKYGATAGDALNEGIRQIPATAKAASSAIKTLSQEVAEITTKQMEAAKKNAEYLAETVARINDEALQRQKDWADEMQRIQDNISKPQGSDWNQIAARMGLSYEELQNLDVGRVEFETAKIRENLVQSGARGWGAVDQYNDAIETAIRRTISRQDEENSRSKLLSGY